MLKVPFFEFGPKAYLYGKKMLEIAEYADTLVKEFGVDIILDPQTVDIPCITARCKYIHVFAQHLDGIPVGRGMASLLPEALKAAGADGALLNHAEKRMTLFEIENAVRRAGETGLMTMVCADNPDQAAALAVFSPDVIVVESPAQIGGASRTADDNRAIRSISDRIHAIAPDTKILHAAGIKNAEDVYNIIAAGSDGSGSSSAIALAADPGKMLHDMVEAVRRAWDDSNFTFRLTTRNQRFTT
jgi:triosephosphate isomerase